MNFFEERKHRLILLTILSFLYKSERKFITENRVGVTRTLAIMDDNRSGMLVTGY